VRWPVRRELRPARPRSVLRALEISPDNRRPTLTLQLQVKRDAQRSAGLLPEDAGRAYAGPAQPREEAHRRRLLTRPDRPPVARRRSARSLPAVLNLVIGVAACSVGSPATSTAKASATSAAGWPASPTPRSPPPLVAEASWTSPDRRHRDPQPSRQAGADPVRRGNRCPAQDLRKDQARHVRARPRGPHRVSALRTTAWT